jgi:hypothetical protein
MSANMRRSFGSTGLSFSRLPLMSRSAQRRRIALSNPRLAKPLFGSLFSLSPSVRSRLASVGTPHARDALPRRVAPEKSHSTAKLLTGSCVQVVALNGRAVRPQRLPRGRARLGASRLRSTKRASDIQQGGTPQSTRGRRGLLGPPLPLPKTIASLAPWADSAFNRNERSTAMGSRAKAAHEGLAFGGGVAGPNPQTRTGAVTARRQSVF